MKLKKLALTIAVTLILAAALDASGDIWVANGGNNTVTEVIGAAVPVITPIAAGLPATPTVGGVSNLGTRP